MQIDTPSIEELEAQRGVVVNDTSLTESEKATALLLYDQALRSTRDTGTVGDEIDAVRALADSAPGRIEELQTLLKSGPIASRELSETYQQLSDKALADAVERARLDVEVAVDEFRERRFAVRELTISPLRAAGRTAEVFEALLDEGPPQAGPQAKKVHELIVLARRSFLLARAAERRMRRDLARERFAMFDVLSQLTFLEQQLALRNLQNSTARHDALVTTVEARRVTKARGETRNAEVAVAAMTQMPDALRRLAAENLALRVETEEALRVEAQAASLRRARRVDTLLLEMDLQFAAQRLLWAGANKAVGQLIRDRLGDMPSLLEIQQARAARSEARSRAVERRIQLERRMQQAANSEITVAAIIESIPSKDRAELGEAWLRQEATELVRARRESTLALYTVNGRYLWILARLDDTATRIVSVVNKGLELRRQDLLWIRNLPPITGADYAQWGEALSLLSSLSGWRAVLRSALGSFRVRPWTSFALLALLLTLICFQPRSRRRLTQLSEQVARVRTDAFAHTLEAAMHTVILAAAVPLALVWVGWLARSEPWSGSFSAAVGHALISAGLTLFAFTLLRWACRPEGLCRHFRWPEAVRSGLSRELRWLAPLLVTARAAEVFADHAGNEALTLAMGRPAIVFTSVAFAVLVWRLFGPGSALNALLRSSNQALFAARWRRVWYPLLQIAPILIAASSLLGYHYAAVQLAEVLAHTMALFLGVILLRDVLLRWFYVAERRLRLEAALRYREEARAERARGEERPDDQVETAEIEVEEVDYRELGEQGRTAVRVGVMVGTLLGLWALWGDLLPAIGVLERVELPLSQMQVVDGIERQVPITLSDLGLVVLVVAGVFFAARNLSGLLGFVFLQRLRFDPGASYAIVTLSQYLLIGGGLIYAFSAIGLQWSKLQWLVAALGVGLGFGLQEIVANFVSGIILLLERPVRVGDIVTVGDTDGTVARIRIRATTIVTFERKELVVPNKEFITTRVLNWSLSDAELRLLIVVGIAYGSDVRKARDLIYEAASEADYVLEEPSPIVTFGGFGDNALNIELRCFLPDMDHWHSTKTAIHDAIYEKLNDAGIVIAFPQRDVHMDFVGPVDVRLQPAGGK